MRRLVCTFLAQSDRAHVPWYHCEHVHMLGLPTGDACVWFEQSSVSHEPEFMVYHAFLIWENPVLSWCKLAFRCALAAYILRVVWRRYYTHYTVLVNNLTAHPIRDDRSIDSVEVVMGDPTYLVLSNPFVLLVMIVDMWLGISYVAIAAARASQYEDWMSFALGCVYNARFVRCLPMHTTSTLIHCIQVWAGYMMMWMLSRAAKRRGLEGSFAPVDPAHLGVLAYLYAGPIVLLLARTTMMVMYHRLWDLLVPTSALESHIETLPGAVAPWMENT
ncbi:hypothetical protein DYB32_007178 [Aphanomyces invadans]|uniref:Uncharacterized protein n=1 Tax=Aphanomyces invadans TaxID=157072 RepID=A0A3R6Z1K8_9STRA|nr:hypothetical protein DYB32_007178 [Aphanomyces invadans]